MSTLFEAIPWGSASSGLTTPPTAHKYRVADPMVATAETDVDRANKLVQMSEVLADWDRFVPADSTSWKMHCPLDFEHGSEKLYTKTARYYGTANAVMCFKMHGWLTPVRLRSRQWKMSQIQAARRILREAGEGRPGWYRQRWFDLQAKKEQRVDELPDPQYAVAALNVALTAMPGYSLRQYDEDVRAVLEEVMEELVDGVTVDEMRSWVERSAERIRACV